MEKSLTARDGKTIYYTLHHADKGKSDKVIILGHGLTDNRFAHVFQMADPIFTAAGYDVIRIAFYDYYQDARNLDECTVEIHANDLNDLIAEIHNDYSSVFYVGHSYGGLTALLAKPKINGVALWDGTYIPSFLDEEAVFVPELDCYKGGWGTTVLFSKAMVEEAKSLSHAVMKEKVKSFNSPVFVAIAGENLESVQANGRLLIQDLPEPKTFSKIEGATHNFWERGVAEDLAKKTLEWFEGYAAQMLH